MSQRSRSKEKTGARVATTMMLVLSIFWIRTGVSAQSSPLCSAVSAQSTPLCGDINNDGQVDLRDALSIAQFLAGNAAAPMCALTPTASATLGSSFTPTPSVTKTLPLTPDANAHPTPTDGDAAPADNDVHSPAEPNSHVDADTDGAVHVDTAPAHPYANAYPGPHGHLHPYPRTRSDAVFRTVRSQSSEQDGPRPVPARYRGERLPLPESSDLPRQP